MNTPHLYFADITFYHMNTKVQWIWNLAYANPKMQYLDVKDDIINNFKFFFFVFMKAFAWEDSEYIIFWFTTFDVFECRRLFHLA